MEEPESRTRVADELHRIYRSSSSYWSEIDGLGTLRIFHGTRLYGENGLIFGMGLNG